jgi:uncharacterized protein DUF1320
MPTTAQGLYAAQCDIEDIFGITNVAIWSQLDPTQPPGTADVTRIQRALDYSDATIVSFFRNQGNYATPLAPLDTDATLVKRWSATLAGVWLYESRDLRDQAATGKASAKEGNRYSQMAQQVIAEMGPYRSQQKLNAVRRWPSPTAPAGM